MTNFKIKSNPKPKLIYAYIEGNQLAVDVKLGKKKYGGYIPEIKNDI